MFNLGDIVNVNVESNIKDLYAFSDTSQKFIVFYITEDKSAVRIKRVGCEIKKMDYFLPLYQSFHFCYSGRFLLLEKNI